MRACVHLFWSNFGTPIRFHQSLMHNLGGSKNGHLPILGNSFFQISQSLNAKKRARFGDLTDLRFVNVPITLIDVCASSRLPLCGLLSSNTVGKTYQCTALNILILHQTCFNKATFYTWLGQNLSSLTFNKYFGWKILNGAN